MKGDMTEAERQRERTGRCYLADFEDRERGHEARNAGGSTAGKSRKHTSPTASRNQPCLLYPRETDFGLFTSRT